MQTRERSQHNWRPCSWRTLPRRGHYLQGKHAPRSNPGETSSRHPGGPCTQFPSPTPGRDAERHFAATPIWALGFQHCPGGRPAGQLLWTPKQEQDSAPHQPQSPPEAQHIQGDPGVRGRHTYAVLWPRRNPASPASHSGWLCLFSVPLLGASCLLFSLLCIVLLCAV